MSPLTQRKSPNTPAKARLKTPRVSIPTSTCAPAREPLNVSRRLDPLESPRPSPNARTPGCEDGLIEPAGTHFDAEDRSTPELADTSFGPRRLTPGQKKSKRASPESPHPSVDSNKVEMHGDFGRRPNSSRVLSSNRTSLPGSGQHRPVPAVTPIASSPYIPPHMRNVYHSRAANVNSPLAGLDRSACPESEDSFYSHISSTFSPLTPLSTPSTSMCLSPPTSASQKGSARYGLRTSTPAAVASTAPQEIAKDEVSSRRSKADFSFRQRRQGSVVGRSRPFLIDGEAREDKHAHGPTRPESPRTWADEVEDEYSVENYITLSSAEEALLAHDSLDETGDAGMGIDVQIAVQLRRGSTVASSPVGVPEDETEPVEGACTGCGAEEKDCFVNLAPCGHTLCPVCMNALINAVAHKPPRPTTCFACSSPVISFVPSKPEVGEGKGLVTVFLDSLAQGRIERRPSLEGPADALAHNTEQSVNARRRRRRSSVVAAAFATIFATPTKIRHCAPTGAPSPVDTIDAYQDEHDNGIESPLARRIRPESASATASIPIASLSPGAELVEGLPPHIPRSSSGEQVPHDSPGQDALSPATAQDQSRLNQPVQPVCERANIDWPVVRLDNVPWEVTVDELEAWLPRGVLANDNVSESESKGVSESLEGSERLGAGEGVTLAVHILCNRADGRTLNQAYIECSSRAAARSVVRLRDGVKLRNRNLHVTISSQSELLSTVFPTYRPGFEGLRPISQARSGASAPVPLLVQTELTGLLNLCHLESAHAKKAPERPFFNIVTLLEKMPWAYPESYNSAAIVRLFNTSCAAIEILATVKSSVGSWREILAVLVDAILRCPVLRPQQKQKAVHLAASLGYEGQKLAVAQLPLPLAVPVSSGVAGVFEGFKFPYEPISLKEAYVSTASGTDAATNGPPSVWCAGTPPSTETLDRIREHATSFVPVSTIDALEARESRRRRRSSLVAELGIEPTVLDAVAKALGVPLGETALASIHKAQDGAAGSSETRESA